MTLVRKKATLAPFGVGSSTLDAFDTVVISGGTGSGTAANGIVTFMPKKPIVMGHFGHRYLRVKANNHRTGAQKSRHPSVKPMMNCSMMYFPWMPFLAFGGEFFAERPAVDALSAHPANGALKSNQRCIT